MGRKKGRGREENQKSKPEQQTRKKINAIGKHVSTITLSVNGSTCQEMQMLTRMKSKIRLLAVSKKNKNKNENKKTLVMLGHRPHTDRANAMRQCVLPKPPDAEALTQGLVNTGKVLYHLS